MGNVTANKMAALEKCLASQIEAMNLLKRLAPEIQWANLRGEYYASPNWLKKIGNLSSSTLGNLSSRRPDLFYDTLGSIKVDNYEDLDEITKGLDLSAAAYSGILVSAGGVNFLSPVTMLILLTSSQERIEKRIKDEFSMTVTGRSYLIDLMNIAARRLKKRQKAAPPQAAPEPKPAPVAQPPNAILRVIRKNEQNAVADMDTDGVYCDAAVFPDSRLTTIAAFDPQSMRCIIRRHPGVMPIASAEVLAIQLAKEMNRSGRIYTDHLHAVTAFKEEREAVTYSQHRCKHTVWASKSPVKDIIGFLRGTPNCFPLQRFRVRNTSSPTLNTSKSVRKGCSTYFAQSFTQSAI
jgi:hypothetical protein